MEYILIRNNGENRLLEPISIERKLNNGFYELVIQIENENQLTTGEFYQIWQIQEKHVPEMYRRDGVLATYSETFLTNKEDDKYVFRIKDLSLASVHVIPGVEE